jgi:hypothetical protein
MHTWDINTYKGRLLGALQAYENKVLQRGGVHPQRVQDIRFLRDCIHSLYDPALLDSELQAYLSKMVIRRTWSAYFWGQPFQSDLKRMLEVVMADEQAKTLQLEQLCCDYSLYQQLLAGNRLRNGHDSHSECTPPQQFTHETQGMQKKKIAGAIGWCPEP